MKGKLLFVAGAAVGYVLGARAGRKRYEQIKSAAERVWETPGVQNQVEQAKDFAAQAVGDVPGALADGAKKAFTAMAGARKSPRQSSSARGSSAQTSSASTSSSTNTSTAEKKPATQKPATQKPAAKKSTAAKKPAAKKSSAAKSASSGSGSKSSDSE